VNGDLADAWQEGDDRARWRSGTGHEGTASGSSIIEIDAGGRLPRHTDSAEEAIVVVTGTAEVMVDEDRWTVSAGGVALVPEDVPHEVRNAGEDTLRFVAVYAAPAVVTRYEADVLPDGERERRPVG
jgi:quercetin dioxygenase-like cupin family protein